MVDLAAGHQERTGITPLWGTANLFTNPRYQAGAATNPDPEVFAYAAAQVRHCLDATHRLGGHNYVLWGGREGYDTLLNTDLRRELDQLGRFLTMVVEHKHNIGFTGTILIEPKPFEPTKHQYDYDVAAVHAFLQRYDLVGDVKVNIEVNHATLAGHDFAHEVAAAAAAGIFGSVDANAGDDRLGWDVDRFPVSVEQMTLGMLEILRSGGFTTGGFNFDAKLRRQSIDRTDLFHGHIGGIDTLARRCSSPRRSSRMASSTPTVPRVRRLGRGPRAIDPRRRQHPGVTPRARPRPRRAHAGVGWPGEVGEPRRPLRRPGALSRRQEAAPPCPSSPASTRPPPPPRSRCATSTPGRWSGAAPRRTHRLSRPGRSRSRTWWQAFEAAWGEAGDPHAAAVSVAGQQHGMVALDDDRRAIRPAKLWNDTESAPEAVWLIGRLPGGRQAWADACGLVPVASFTITKLAWLHRHEPRAWSGWPMWSSPTTG